MIAALLLAAAAPSAMIGAVQQAAGAATPLDMEGLRFTAIDAGGRGATIYQAMRKGGRAERTTIFLVREADGSWSVANRESRYLAGETFDYFVGRIDAAAAEPAGDAACTGSTAFFAEHGERMLAGCTADDPAGRIARSLGLIDEDAPGAPR